MSFSTITQTDLLDAFANKKMAVFTGAGLSVDPPSFCPNWDMFRSMIIRSLLRVVRTAGLLDKVEEKSFEQGLIQEFHPEGQRLFKPEVFMQLMREEIGDHALGVLSILKGGSYNENHLFLAQAAKSGQLPVIITTNFDEFIEEALDDQGVEYDLYSRPSEFENLATMSAHDLSAKVSVVKLHGTVTQPESIRMTLLQAARPLESDKANVLRNVIRNFEVIFYGYSGNDDDIHPVLLSLRDDALGVTWCLWDSEVTSANTNELLMVYESKAKVLNQNKEPLLPKLSAKLGYGGHALASHKNFDFVDNQKTLDQWSEPMHPVHALHILGVSSRSIANLELARTAFWKELDLLKEEKLWKAYARTSRALGEVFDIFEDYNSAFDSYGESFIITEKIGDRIGYADTCVHLARIQMYLGATEKALELLDESIDIYEAFDNPLGLAGALNSKGQLLLYGQEIEGAQENFSRSLAILEKEGDLANAAAISSNLAMTFRLQGDTDHARSLLQKAIELDSQHGNLQGVASSFGNIAFLEEEIGQYQEALASISRAIDIYSKIGAETALKKHLQIRDRIKTKLK